MNLIHRIKPLMLIVPEVSDFLEKNCCLGSQRRKAFIVSLQMVLRRGVMLGA